MGPKTKNDISPPSPSFSHNVMDQISNSFSSRRSSGNNFARFAFNIYGGNSNTTNNNTSPSSNPYQALGNSMSSSSNSSYSRINHQFQNYNTSEYNEANNSTKFLSSSEILTFDHSKVDNSIIAIGGQRLFQILRVDDDLNEIVIENDLNHSVQASRSNKGGAVSDLKFGFHQYCHFIAAATIAGNINLYNLSKSNKIISTLSDHSRAVNTLDFNPNQNQSLNHSLMSGSQDGTIKLWDLRTKSTKSVLTILGSSDPVRGVQFSPHVAKKIVGIFDSGVIKKYDLRNPSQPERKLNAHTGPGLSIDWHPELDYIASGGRDKQIQVWNMSTASNDTRVPDFVVNAAGAVAKVKWSPQSCNGNILESKIATSFFSDDPCVQIWNLNRKYIPDCIIESHVNQVTAILWRDQDTLWSSSKDKSIVQHDLRRCPKFIDNLPKYGVDWATSNNELAFIQQDKDSFNQKSLYSSNTVIPTHSSDANLSQSFVVPSTSASTTGLSFTPVTTSPLQNFERPALGRSLTHKPQLVRNMSNQTGVVHSLRPTPFICPVNLPFRDNDPLILEFLSSHYLNMVPEGMDLASVCEYNSIIASSAGQFRESQTWKVINTSIAWQYGQGIDYLEIKKDTKKLSQQDKFHSYRSVTNSRTNSELDIGSLGSHSTGNYFGLSPNTNYSVSANFTPPLHYSREALAQLAEQQEYPRAYEGLQMKDNENDHDLEADKILKEKEVENDADNDLTIVDNEESSTADDTAKPIMIQTPRKKRLSFNGYPHEPIPYAFSGSIPDYDDETKEYQSSSAGRSPVSLKSSLSSQRHESFSQNTWKSMVNSKLTPIHKFSRSDSKKSSKSGKSALSRVLREHQMANNEEAITDDDDDNDDDDEDEKTGMHEEGEDDISELVAPWTPELLIKESAEYNAHQGNIVMCATLALLFLPYYKGNSISRYQAMDWIYTYHDILLRRLLFSTAADVLKTASKDYPVMKQKGQTETSLRFFCANCKELIINESSKQKHQEDDEVDFGYWYCDNCKKINSNCCYCNEMIKGMTISTMPCGHIAHFGCFRTWFLEEEEKCCPACAQPVFY